VVQFGGGMAGFKCGKHHWKAAVFSANSWDCVPVWWWFCVLLLLAGGVGLVMARSRSIVSVLPSFFAASPRIRCDHSRAQYAFAVGDLSEFLGRPARLSDLQDETIGRLMVWLAKPPRALAARTINGRRDRLNCLWRWLCRSGRRVVWPANLPAVVPRRVPRAWSHDELQRLFDAGASMPGRVNGFSAAIWWPAFLGLLWDTGERCGAALALRWEMLDWASGSLWVPAEIRKGARSDDVHQLQGDTLAALRRLLDAGGGDGLHIFGQPRHYSTFYQTWWPGLLKRAGLPRGRREGPQKLRRSFASHIAAAGGDPSFALGHSSQAITRRHYLDPTICGHEVNRLLFRLLPVPSAAASVLDDKRANCGPRVAGVGRHDGR
jgi:integrase